MLAIKRLAGVAPEVNLKEHTSHMPLPNVKKAAYSGFEVQNRGIRGPIKKTCVHRIFLKKSYGFCFFKLFDLSREGMDVLYLQCNQHSCFDFLILR